MPGDISYTDPPEDPSAEGAEFAAGWFDGMRAARAMLRNRFRRELHRYALTLDPAGEITVRLSDGPVPLEPVPEPDNPRSDPEYARGYERGYVQVHHLILERIRGQLRDAPPFSTSAGTITATRLSRELSHLFADHLRSRPEPVDSATIHAFIDGILVRPTAPSPPPSLRSRLTGALAMIRKKVDRRVAIVTLGGLLATTSLGVLGYRQLFPGPRTQPTAATVYNRPSTWEQYPREERDYYLHLDYLFWQVESQSPTPPPPVALGAHFNSLTPWVEGIAAQAGLSQTKSNLASFLADSDRLPYVPFLLPLLDSAQSDYSVRTAVVSSLIRIARRHGAAAFHSSVQQALLAAFNAESDPRIGAALDDLLTRLGIPH